MTESKDKRPRCGEEGLGHGDICILRPHHEGDHHFQPKGQPRAAAKTWSKKPSLSEGVKDDKKGVPGTKDYRTTSKDETEDARAKRDE